MKTKQILNQMITIQTVNYKEINKTEKIKNIKLKSNPCCSNKKIQPVPIQIKIKITEMKIMTTLIRKIIIINIITIKKIILINLKKKNNFLN